MSLCVFMWFTDVLFPFQVSSFPVHLTCTSLICYTCVRLSPPPLYSAFQNSQTSSYDSLWRTETLPPCLILLTTIAWLNLSSCIPFMFNLEVCSLSYSSLINDLALRLCLLTYSLLSSLLIEDLPNIIESCLKILHLRLLIKSNCSLMVLVTEPLFGVLIMD